MREAKLAGQIRLEDERKQLVTARVENARTEADAQAYSVEASLRPLKEMDEKVLQLLAEGKSAKQIALELDISAKTVETHRTNVKQKLGIDSVAGLTKYALRQGLTPL